MGLHLPRVSALAYMSWVDREGNPNILERFGQRLFRACRIDQSAYGGDAIGRNAHSPGVFLDDRLVRGEINAVHLIASYVAMKPLDLWTEYS